MRTKDKLGKFICYIIFVLFFVFLFFQQNNVFLQHDDYAYATLSYAYKEPNVFGREYIFSQLLHYLFMHWKIWGGRVLYFAQMILLLKSESLLVINLFQSAIICAIFFMMWKIAIKGNHTSEDKNSSLEKNEWAKKIITSAFICLSFGYLSSQTFTSGVYWYAASSCYVWPIFYILLSALLYHHLIFKDLSNRKRICYYCLCIIFSFLSGFSMEQTSIMAVAILCAITCYAYFIGIGKRKLMKQLPIVLTSIIGFLILILAPGNDVRKTIDIYSEYYTNKNLIERIGYSLHNIVVTFFSRENIWFILFFIIGSIVCAIFNFSIIKKKKLFIIYLIVGITMGIVSFYSYYVWTNPYLNYFFTILSIIFIIATLIQTVIFLSVENHTYDFLLIFIVLGGYLSVVSMVLSPIFIYRNLLMFELIYFMFGTRLLIKILNINTRYMMLIVFIGIGFTTISVKNLYTLYSGYQENLEVNKYNEQQFIDASHLSNEKLKNHVIKLMKIPNEAYGDTQPYDRPMILEWMSNYYSVPSQVSIAYLNYDRELLYEIKNDNLINSNNIIDTIDEFPGHIDSIIVNSKKEKSNVSIKSGDQIEIEGWIVNEHNYSESSKMYIKIGEYFFQCNKIQREDVAEHFNNGNYINSGFYCNIIIGEIPEGIYPLEIVVEDEIEDKYISFRMPYVANLYEFSGSIDSIIINSKGERNTNFSIRSGDQIEIEGWVINELAFDDLSKIYIKIGESIFLCNKSQREDVADYFNNINYVNSGFYCSINIGEIEKGIYPLEIMIQDEIQGDSINLSTSYIININE